MVVDAVICLWVTVVRTMEVGAEGLGALVKDIAAYFYAENRLVTWTQPEILQRAFEVLTDLLNQVGLRKNTHETMSM